MSFRRPAGWMVVGLAVASCACAQQPAASQKAVATKPAPMTQHVDPNLDVVLTYPADLLPRAPEALRTVWQREHMHLLGGAEFDPVEYRVVLGCMNTLFEATGERKPVRDEHGEYAPEALLIADVDRRCVDGEVKGDRALAVLADVVLRTHQMTPLVTPAIVQAEKHRIHTGLSSGMMIVNDPGSAVASAENGRQSPVYVAAASLEQQQHWILVMYINGTSGEQNAALGRTSLSFHGGPPVMLFPFLNGQKPR